MAVARLITQRIAKKRDQRHACQMHQIMFARTGAVFAACGSESDSEQHRPVMSGAPAKSFSRFQRVRSTWELIGKRGSGQVGALTSRAFSAGT